MTKAKEKVLDMTPEVVAARELVQAILEPLGEYYELPRQWKSMHCGAKAMKIFS